MDVTLITLNRPKGILPSPSSLSRTPSSLPPTRLYHLHPSPISPISTRKHVHTFTHAIFLCIFFYNVYAALNALCDPLMREIATALDAAEADVGVGAIVITGSEKAFAGLLCFCLLCGVPCISLLSCQD